MCLRAVKNKNSGSIFFPIRQSVPKRGKSMEDTICVRCLAEIKQQLLL